MSDHEWSGTDPEDYGLLFEDFIQRFGVRDERFDFDRHWSGPAWRFPFAWARWRLCDYPSVVVEKMTVADMVRMADRGVWDRRVEPVGQD